jgi:hypothetical protein
MIFFPVKDIIGKVNTRLSIHSSRLIIKSMATGKYSVAMMIILLGLSSCVKDPQDIPSGFSSDPVFTLKAQFDQETISIEAGANGWTMLPEVNTIDSSTVYTAVFSKNGCLDQCAPSWTFRFYQAHNVSSEPISAFQKTITTGEKDFIISDQERKGYDISLSTPAGLFMGGYSFWEDLNGLSTTFSNEYHSIVAYNQQMNVCFKSQALTGCQYKQCIYFDPATAIPCLSSIEPIVENPRNVSLRVKMEGTAPFQVSWFNGASTSSIVIPIQDSVAVIYASVSVTDALGNRSDLAQKIRYQNGNVDGCYFPISLMSTSIDQSSPESFANRVEIIYKDQNGAEWRSSAGIQPDESSVMIEGVKSYELSPSQQPAFVVDLGAVLFLFHSETGEARRFEANQISLALSHP